MLVRRYRSGQSKLGATFVFVFLLVLIGSKPKANGQGNKPFYEGKTIQLLVASGPGATTDISARLVAATWENICREIPASSCATCRAAAV